DGRVYEHVRFRARGGVWRYAMCKNLWKFDLNRGHGFEARDDWGRKLGTKWSKLNLGASIQQGDYNHRGEQGMFESTGFRMFRLAGVPAMHSAFTQFRVIDDAAETSTTSQFEGDFWGIYLMLEQPDGSFVEEHGLPDGNLFKMEGGGGELNHLGNAGPADNSDLSSFLSRYNGATESWWRTNFHIPRYLSYQTVVQAIHHYDICYDKNFFYFRDAARARWEVIPWDLDLTWAENMFDSGCGGVDRIKERLLPEASRYPAVWREWQNRIREYRDLFWNADEAWRLIDEQAGRLRGPATGATLLDADRAQWDYNPRMVSGTYSTSPDSKAGHGRYYRWPNYPAAAVERTFNGVAQVMKRYVMFRATNSAARARNLDALAFDPAIPTAPQLTYTGSPGFPANGLRFARTAASGGATLAAAKWRLGEVTKVDASTPSWAASEPWKYEIEAVWESGPVDPDVPEIEVPPGVVESGRTYRARVQLTDLEGRTSNWSAPVEFVAGAASGIADLERDLKLTEIMYHAAAGSADDFLELHNAGTTVLDLGGASFTSGITFTFPAGTRIPAGGYLVVCKDQPGTGYASFRAAYGLSASVAVVGPYTGNLSDAGEQVVLTAAGGGTSLLSVTFSDGLSWPVQADGAGSSLVAVTGQAAVEHPGLDDPLHWRASASLGGSPGGADPEPVREVMLNEVVAHTDFLSEFDSNDWVELYRAADTSFVFGAGWSLSDDPANLTRWPIPAGTVVPARGRVVFDEVTGFNTPRGTGFSLNKEGEQVFLSHLPAQGKGRVVDAVAFKGQENDWALARVPDGGDFWDQVTPRTRGSANASPGSRVIVSEVMYHSGTFPTNQVPEAYQEYVELHNLAATPVPLYNTNAVWRLNGGVSFDLPLFITLAAGERVVVVAFDPVANPSLTAAFRSLFAVPATVRIFGPLVGRFDNDSDRVALERAQSPDTAGQPISWVIVDEITYADRGIWPTAADGEGSSLTRTDTTRSGRDPRSWSATPPSPGTAPAVTDPDLDDDGLPDAWEREHGLNPGDASDAARDADGDGASNLAEYLAGTDPTESGSVLRFTQVRWAADGTLMCRFPAAAGRGYVIESRRLDGTPAWATIVTVPVGATARDVEVSVGAPSGAGAFLRLRLGP
ncbi:MAG: lamin tail domain-containing protein, partial [Verrucomicrobiales bacterium]|nr:lamin tail domain-containing protein [Verrucomicrobiales bacterium]